MMHSYTMMSHQQETCCKLINMSWWC